MLRWLPWILLLGIAGCAGTPESLRDAPEAGPEPDAVRADAEAYLGDRVRWGGIITEVENGAEETRIVLLARRLGSSGRPGEADGGGRFLVRFEGFLDPAVYRVGREITVVGEVTGATVRRVGNYHYRHPMVAAERHHLWAEEQPVVRDRYYDPWYGPYYSPFYPYRHPWY